MKKVSIFTHFIYPTEHITLAELLDRIKRCVYGEQIRKLRLQLAAGNLEESDKLKKQLLGVTFGGLFDGGRNMKCIVEYNGYLVLDFDDLTAAELLSVHAKIILCQYTLACFVSPSGNGLKVIVSVTTGVEEHLNAFLSLQKFYNAMTGVEIDPSGKDVTRLCFVSADEHLYYNPDATVFEPHSGAGQAWPAAVPKGPAVKPTGAVNIDKIYRRAVVNVERYHSYVEGQRNEFNFALAFLLRKYGISEATTLVLLLRDYNFSDQEVHACVKSAYSYNLTDKPKVAKGKKFPPLKIVPKAEAPPDEPPTSKKKKAGYELYDIMEVESLLHKWYDTRYNVVTGVVEWRIKGSDEPFEWLEDKHEHSMFCRLHRENQMIPMSTVHIMLHSDFSPDFDPFMDYFNNLAPWDGTTDFMGQLCDTVSTEDDAYWKFTFIKWYVAYVASMIVPDIINHTVVVLIGAQGAGKTSWMKKLMPQAMQALLGTTALQIDSKDTAIQLSECGLIILDEMENLNRKDLSAIKELVTRSKSRIRRPYGRNSESLQHRASLIAGVNHAQILTDISGTRRYLCSSVISIDYLHQVDIDGCMAQAYAHFRSGFRYWFDQTEIKELTAHNIDFVSKSVEEELIATWFIKVTREEWDNKGKFANSQRYMLMTTTEIAVKIMEKARFNLLESTVVKIGRILTYMGFKRIRKGNNHSYMVRLVDGEAVERASHTLELTPEQVAEQDDNDQIVRLEEDLFTANTDDGLPF